MLDYSEIVRALREGAGSRRREALRILEMECAEEEQDRFISYAAGLGTDICLDLCSILSQTTSPRLVELLRRYAEADEPLLRARALAALQKVPDAVRHDACLTLLSHRDTAVRIAACRMLATSGSRSAGEALRRLLDDNDRSVLAEAIRSLRRLRHTPAREEAARLLAHADAEIRQEAIEMLIELGGDNSLLVPRLCTILAADPAAEVRATAAWALGQTGSSNAAPALRQALGDKHSSVAAAAAQALIAYPNAENIAALLHAASRSAVAEIALSCKRALASMDASLVFDICIRLLHADEPRLRMETAMALASLGLAGAGHILCERLRIEPDTTVQACLLEALGQGGWREHWAEIRSHVRGPAEVAYAAIGALAKLVDGARLEDFTAILEEVEENSLREIVLRRLALLGRSRSLAPSLWPILRRYLRHPARNLAILAADAAAGIASDAPLAELIAARASSDDAEFRRVAAAAVLRLCRNDLCALVAAHRDSVAILPELMAQMTSLGEQGAQICLCLAALAASGEKAAACALAAAGRLDPLAIIAAMRQAEDEAHKAALLHAWQAVPREVRGGMSLDYASLLRACAPQVRSAALATVEAETSENLLPLLVDLALRDPDENVRRIAVQTVKRVVEAG